MKILNLGSLNIDYVYSVEDFVKPGETISAISLKIFAGGKGLNQSIALAKAGAEVYHLGAAGKNSDFLLRKLRSASVKTDFISELDEDSGHAIIQVNKSGENCIIIHPGTNKKISLKNLRKALAKFAKGDYFLTQNETNLVPEAMELAAKKKLKVAFNPAPMTEDVKDYPLRFVHTIILNQSEAKYLFGREDISDEDILKIVKKYNFAEFILTLGSNGALYCDGTKVTHQKAFKVKAVDSTAAGDTFVGFYLAERIKGSPAEYALKFASAAAALSVAKKGASDSIPDARTVKSFIKNQA